MLQDTMPAPRTIAEKLQEHPVIAIWAVVWIVIATLNFSAGMKVGGVLLAFSFVSIAALAAYAAGIAADATGGRRVGLGALICLQLALGQWAGWSTLGINLSKGAAGLESDAGTHNTTSDLLGAAKKERASLGTPRPIAAIEADEHLECESGIGPKCTILRRELANAQRAGELDAKIPELMNEFRGAPQLTDANAPYRVAMSFASLIASAIAGKPVEATRDDVIYYFEIFLTLLLEFIGTCGPWLFQIAEKWHDPKPARRQVAVDNGWADVPRRITHQPNSAGTSPDPARAPHDPRSATGPLDHGDHSMASGGWPGSPGGSGRPTARADGLNLPAQTPASIPSEQHQHGAPITVNLFGSTADGGRLPERQSPSANIDSVSDRNVHALRQVVRQPMTPEIEASVRAAPEIPVDRSHLQGALDGLLVFKARELVAQSGAWTEASQVYARYAEWAKERALAAEAFNTLFVAATGVELKELGGVKHYANVALRRHAVAKEAS